MRKFLFVVTGFMLVLGCNTHQSVSTENMTDVYLQATESPTGCLGEFPSCDDVNAPQYCHVTVNEEFSGKIKKHEFYSWERNRCLAMKEINMQLCKKAIVGKQPSWVECKPAATNGQCPVRLGNDCSPTVKPVTCFAGYYGAHTMPFNQTIEARASNKCLALGKLWSMACRKNLDPSQLTHISCEDNQMRRSEKETPDPSLRSG
ncbi:MAG: hypothetical protein R3B45_14340 [Bdellovibrionota bacterium]